MTIITIDHITEFARMFRYRVRVGFKGFNKRKGDAENICNGILDDLYKGFFHTGIGNYPEFYSRDFGMMVPALLSVGRRKECVQTLHYALDIYRKQGKITTQITPNHKAVNFPNVYSPDSVAYVFRSLRLIKDTELIARYAHFLQGQYDLFVGTALKKNGMIKRRTHFGGMRDYAIRDASCYDTVMAAVIQNEARMLGLKTKKFDYESILKKQYWTGDFFRDDLANKTMTADANIYPFWLDIITDRNMLKKAITSMQKAKLDKPFPIKYVAQKEKRGKMIWTEMFVPNWEGSSIWPMSGLPYIEILAKIDQEKALMHLKQYKKLIEKYGTFIEVYDEKGEPFSSAVFNAGESMIWCALWLKLWNQSH